MKDVDSSNFAEEFMKSQQKIFAANACSFRSSVVDKAITLGRVEALVKVYLNKFCLSVADKVV